MPTSSGHGASYRSGRSSYNASSTSTLSRRPLPDGPGPLDMHNRRIATLPPVATGKHRPSYTSGSDYSQKNLYNAYRGTSQIDDPLSHRMDKMDLNNNYHTSSSAYGNSYTKSLQSTKVNDCSTSNRTYIKPTISHHSTKAVSSRSSSVESMGYQPSTPTKTSVSSLGANNFNDSCGSHDSTSDLDVGHGGMVNKGNVGLTNLGNTCFMNSVLQCLLNTRVLVEYVLSDQRERDINKTNSSMKGALMDAYAQLVAKVWKETPGRAVAPKDLKAKVQRYAPRFSGYNQQDAQEFLRYLLEGLHEDVNRVKTKPKYIGCDEEKEAKMNDEEKAREYWSRYLSFDNSAIVDIFVGQLKSTLRCETCHYESVTFDPFWDLSLPIQKHRHEVNIKDCMDMFMKEEILDGDERPTCANCKKHRTCTKSFKIQRFPKILVLHLKRFSGERFRQKLSTKVNFEVSGLNLKEYGAENKQNATYNLYGISNHVGSVYSGHYTAYSKHPYEGKWYSFNDSNVSRVSGGNLVSEEAYVLFYELQE